MKRTALYILPFLLLLITSCGSKALYPGEMDAPSDSGSSADAPPGGTASPESNPITFIRIPGGMFRMGDVEGAGRSYESPVRLITLPGFEISSSEITNAQYVKYLATALEKGTIKATDKTVVGATGTYSGKAYIHLEGTIEYQYPGNRCWITFADNRFIVEKGKENWPVTYVTWYGAWAFARFYGYDLPTEAEWEYACRGGKGYMFGTDDGTISTNKANYNSINEHPVDVRNYPSNPFGTFDLSGNVHEWCLDWLDSYAPEDPMYMFGFPRKTFRVIRGGSWNLFTFHCRAAYRNFDLPYGAADYLGFRVVRHPVSGR